MSIDPSVVGVGSVIVLLVLIALRVPIAVSLISVSVAGIWLIVGAVPALSLLTTAPHHFIASWTLSAIPMFLLMGFLAFHMGITVSLFRAARAWLSWLPGGLAIATASGAGGFAALTGSTVASAAAIGQIALPEMRRSNYHMGIATGIVAAGGTLGALIPPSLLLILYGIQAQVSITQLFLLGLIVGLFSLILYYVVIILIAIWRPDMLPRGQTYSRKERITSLYELVPVLGLVGAVFGGLFIGLFTATETGAIGALLIGVLAFVRGTFSRSALLASLRDTLFAMGSLTMIVVGANIFTRLAALSGINDWASAGIDMLGGNSVLILLAIAVIYLILGFFLEPIGAMLLTLPIFLPVAETMGLDFLLFGLLLAKVLEVGMITPPVGLNCFVVHSIARDYVKLEQIFLGVIPFVLADIFLIVVIILYIAP